MNCNRCGQVLSKLDNICPKCGYKIPGNFGNIVAERNMEDLEIDKDFSDSKKLESSLLKSFRMIFLAFIFIGVLQFFNIDAFGIIILPAIFLYLFFLKPKTGKYMKTNLMNEFNSSFTKLNLKSRLLKDFNLEDNDASVEKIKKLMKIFILLPVVFFFAVFFLTFIMPIIFDLIKNYE
ncbi:MAG: zinc ribbon domain-containing protein [Patescibacteria group bacterium]|nr:zinc ribbon domain-containing protein [Patescibacteria group bacterium]MDD4304718.1 zinc ribbon domain-containing protein [Patescibacteria group bacterium]MDD4695720.1 zinc ribbon domain-containing protein [Patescibacteria group bacterium]